MRLQQLAQANVNVVLLQPAFQAWCVGHLAGKCFRKISETRGQRVKQVRLGQDHLC